METQNGIIFLTFQEKIKKVETNCQRNPEAVFVRKHEVVTAQKPTESPALEPHLLEEAMGLYVRTIQDLKIL